MSDLLDINYAGVNLTVPEEHVELTQAEYDALPESEKKNGKVYFIKDAVPDMCKDIYSLTETECGVWIDGRKVYRRVFDNFTTPLADGNPRPCTPVVPIFDQGGVLIKAWALVRNSNNAYRIIPVSAVENYFIDEQGDAQDIYPRMWIDINGYLQFKSKEGALEEIPLTLIIEYVKS